MRGSRLARWAILCLAACIGDPPAAELSPEQRARIAQQIVPAPPPGMVPLDAQFSQQLQLVGFILAPRRPRYQPGQQLKLTLIWKRLGSLDAGWQLFTHLLDPRGRIAANLDQQGPLRSLPGVVGTPLRIADWPVGQYVLDPLTFELPPSQSATLRIVAGAYRGRERLEVSGRAAQAAERCALVTQLTVQAPAESIKTLDVPQLPRGTTIHIDGALSEPSWARAADTGAFVNVGNGRPMPAGGVGGHAKLLWDEAYCYVGFEVTDPDVRGGWPAAAVDPHLWEKDTVEIMIDPDGDGDNRDYYEIQINPQNLVFDSQFDGYNQPRGGPNGPFGHQDWQAELQSAVVVAGSLDDDSDRDQGYTVEARLPWRSFTKARRIPPRIGDRWRMNFYAMQHNGGAAWSPILGAGNFHRASRFGRVRWQGALP